MKCTKCRGSGIVAGQGEYMSEPCRECTGSGKAPELMSSPSLTHNQLARVNQAIALLKELAAELEQPTQQQAASPEILAPAKLQLGALYEITHIGDDRYPKHRVGDRLRVGIGPNEIRIRCSERDDSDNPCWYANYSEGGGTWVTGVRLISE